MLRPKSFASAAQTAAIAAYLNKAVNRSGRQRGFWNQVFRRPPGYGCRSVPIMCETCDAKNMTIWGPDPRPPKLSQTRVGNWISLEQCPECKQLWTKAPFEPYAAFEYMVKWPLGIDDWNCIHDHDEGRTMHDWLINEIRRLYATASIAIRDAIESHEQRSYGHYGLTKSVSTNPVPLQT